MSFETEEQLTLSAAAAGRITIGGDLNVARLGYGAMRLTGAGIWGPPQDRGESNSELISSTQRIPMDLR